MISRDVLCKVCAVSRTPHTFTSTGLANQPGIIGNVLFKGCRDALSGRLRVAKIVLQQKSLSGFEVNAQRLHLP